MIDPNDNSSAESFINTIKTAKKSAKTKDGSYPSPRTPWTKEEDEQLITLIKKLGPSNWNEIASSFKIKTAKQCRDHYRNVLDPGIKNSQWTIDEEKTLIQKYNLFGPQWSLISSFLPGRSTTMIRNYTRVLFMNGKINNDEKQRTSSGNSCSEIEDHYNVNSNVKNESNFSVTDISCLLNRPYSLSNSL
ncbi:Transcription factor myb3r-5 [Tritrichomonas musculus]|uniref:Transcription factor myb3r-5 n=1 Tax=Tritrichomonas musculus TaxID=1915356 RepID=A0ABR2KN27_9EUKA